MVAYCVRQQSGHHATTSSSVAFGPPFFIMARWEMQIKLLSLSLITFSCKVMQSFVADGRGEVSIDSASSAII